MTQACTSKNVVHWQHTSMVWSYFIETLDILLGGLLVYLLRYSSSTRVTNYLDSFFFIGELLSEVLPY